MNFDTSQFIHRNSPEASSSSVIYVKKDDMTLANRKGKRAVKPSAKLLSPYAVLHTTPVQKMITDIEIIEIIKLYRSGLGFTIAITGTFKYTPEFWRQLLVLDNSKRWLETNHLCV